MNDDYYPTTDTNFLDKQLRNCSKFEKSITIGSTVTYVMRGEKPIGDRMICLKLDTEVDYMYATGIAIKCKFLSELTSWFLSEKNWKDGAYISVEKEKEEN